MAALNKIRNRAGLLIAVVGVALLSFILGDLFSGNNQQSQQSDIAKVDGQAINYLDYQKRVDDAVENMKRQSGQNSLDEQTHAQIQDQVWNQLVNGVIMDAQLEKVGISVSPEELLDMVQGSNVHPEVKNIPLFKNEETGAFEPEKVVQFIQNLDSDPSGRSREAWMSFEEYLHNERKSDKYFSSISKGIFVTDLYAKSAAIEKSTKMDLKALFLPYAEIADSTIEVNPSELTSYYDRNKSKNQQELSIDVEYVIFPIEATVADKEVIVDELKDIKIEFNSVKDNQNYVSANSDGSFDRKFYAKGEYANSLVDSVMFTMKDGEIFGPYQEAEKFKITKLVKRELQPDSIQIGQIVIVPTTQEEVVAKKALADSLLNLLNKGEKLSNLANYSVDNSSVELSWVKVETLPFSPAVIAVKKGEYVLEATAQGFHIVHVADRGKEVSKIQMATIERVISASENTRTFVYQKANAFAATAKNADSFNKNVEDQGLVKRIANSIAPTARDIRGLSAARSFIREAFYVAEGDIIVYRNNNSPIFELGDSYVVGYLKKRKEQGFTPFNDLKTTIEAAVRKEKKAKQLIEKLTPAIKEGGDIHQIAGKVGATVKEINGLTMSSFSVPGVGIEPNINGVAMTLAKDEMSTPVEGNNGIYLLYVVNKTEVEADKLAIEPEKDNLRRTLQNRVSSEVAKVLEESVEIEDNRLTFQ